MHDEHREVSQDSGRNETTIMFLDLTAFTALNDTHGDDTAVAVVDLFVVAVERAIAGHGRIVKTLGDGVLLQIRDPAAAVQVAQAVNAHLHDHDRTPELTGGASTGPVVERDGDVLGATVNLASRLAGLATTGELWMTEAPARAASAAGWSVEFLGPKSVRGLRRPVNVHRARLCEPDGCVTDPICGMRISPGPTTPTAVLDTRQVWFCSPDCRRQSGTDSTQPDPTNQVAPAPRPPNRIREGPLMNRASRRRTPPAIAQIIEIALADARSADDPWPSLERAHVASQPWAWPHTRVHAIMLATAWRQGDHHEVLGQFIRLVVAGPGSLTNRYPPGNTGRTTMGLTEHGPVPPDLADALSSQ